VLESLEIWWIRASHSIPSFHTSHEESTGILFCLPYTVSPQVSIHQEDPYPVQCHTYGYYPFELDHCPSTGNKLQWMMTEVHKCEPLAISHYMTTEQPEILHQKSKILTTPHFFSIISTRISPLRNWWLTPQVAFKQSWPWPWCWIGSDGIPSCISHWPLSLYQMSLKSEELFVDGRKYRWINVCTYWWTDISPSNAIRSTRRSRSNNNEGITRRWQNNIPQLTTVWEAISVLSSD